MAGLPRCRADERTNGSAYNGPGGRIRRCGVIRSPPRVRPVHYRLRVLPALPIIGSKLFEGLLRPGQHRHCRSGWNGYTATQSDYGGGEKQ